MFDYKLKLKAIKTYYSFDESLSLTVNRLGYPHANTLREWTREYESNNHLMLNQSP